MPFNELQVLPEITITGIKKKVMEKKNVIVGIFAVIVSLLSIWASYKIVRSKRI